MTQRKEEDSTPFILYPLFVALTILFIVFTLITFGIFLPDEKQVKNKVKSNQRSSEKERLRISIERKQNRLKRVSEQINQLNLIKQEIIRTEKRILFFVRLIIATVLIALNYLYLYSNKVSDSFLDIDKIANLNACILLIYSLPAYVLYGTVAKFTTAMKLKTTRVLRKKHIPTFSELQLCKEEETQLKKEIDSLQLRLAQIT